MFSNVDLSSRENAVLISAVFPGSPFIGTMRKGLPYMTSAQVAEISPNLLQGSGPSTAALHNAEL